MDEQEQERARKAIAAQLREEWAGSKAQEKLDHPPRWEWPFNGRQTFRLIVLVVVVAILVPAVFVGIHTADMVNALGTVKSFCQAESTGDYATAYDLLSRRVRSELTQDQVAAKLQAANIAGCSTADSVLDTALGFRNNAGQVQLDMTYSVTGIGAIGGTMTLHQDDEGWRVDALQSGGSFSLF